MRYVCTQWTLLSLNTLRSRPFDKHWLVGTGTRSTEELEGDLRMIWCVSFSIFPTQVLAGRQCVFRDFRSAIL